MIITKTPLRVSLLGGGSDFPSWSHKHGGLVVGGGVNKYSWVTARFLPPFHQHKTRVVYREIEEVASAAEIRHPAVRAAVEALGMQDRGLEIFHAADMPGRSGTGSSSTFLVGLLHALASLKGTLFLPHELAAEATRIEQSVLNETVGCQDQVFAAHGGLNLVRFEKGGGIDVRPLPLDAKQVAALEAHLMLFFTRMPRTSSEVAATYVPTLADRTREQFAMMRLAEQGVEAVMKGDHHRLGWLVDQSWRIKSGLSPAVTNDAVNRLYAKARLAGAWGGKLTGAGGGGSMLLVAPPERHESIKQAIPDALHVPFKFEFGGSRVIFSEKDNLSEYRQSA